MTEGSVKIIGQDTSLSEVFRMLDKVAPTDSTVLISGESGTGKEVLVRALHEKSKRKDKPLAPINCGAIPKELLESELFGHEKGAFTNAIRTRLGRFEAAEGGTVFLDEIGEMEQLLQVKILRVLQEKEISRVGGQETRKVDVRIVAATNRNLEEEVKAGNFREDLFYRLNVVPIHLPPLRERGKDILLLIDYFFTQFCKAKNRPKLKLTSELRNILESYHWPGNIRELENLAERLSILCDSDVVTLDDLPAKILLSVDSSGELAAQQTKQSTSASVTRQGFSWPTIADLRTKGMSLKDFMDTLEEKLLVEALELAGGVKNQAAEVLGIKRTTLIEKLKKRNLE